MRNLACVVVVAATMACAHVEPTDTRESLTAKASIRSSTGVVLTVIGGLGVVGNVAGAAAVASTGAPSELLTPAYAGAGVGGALSAILLGVGIGLLRNSGELFAAAGNPPVDPNRSHDLEARPSAIAATTRVTAPAVCPPGSSLCGVLCVAAASPCDSRTVLGPPLGIELGEDLRVVRTIPGTFAHGRVPVGARVAVVGQRVIVARADVRHALAGDGDVTMVLDVGGVEVRLTVPEVVRRRAGAPMAEVDSYAPPAVEPPSPPPLLVSTSSVAQ